MPANRKRLNHKIIGGNLAEAIEELERLQSRASQSKLHEAELQVGLCHAYHHLNFAWNIRHVTNAAVRKADAEAIRKMGKVSVGNREILTALKRYGW